MRGSSQNVTLRPFQRLGPVRVLLASAALCLAACTVAPRPPNPSSTGDARSTALPQAASKDQPSSAQTGAAPDPQEPAKPEEEAQESATGNASDQAGTEPRGEGSNEEAKSETESKTEEEKDEKKKDKRPERIVLDTVYDDRRVGNDQTAQVEAELGLVKDEKLERYVRDIAIRLLRYAPTLPFDWEFKIVDQTTPNAFALPGGKIYVSRGLLACFGRDGR